FLRGRGKAGDGLIARADDGFEGAALVREISLRGFDQIRNQIVAALQLHLDLRERVDVAILQRHELVVDRDEPDDENDDDPEEYQTGTHAELRFDRTPGSLAQRPGQGCDIIHAAAARPVKLSAISETTIGTLERQPPKLTE